MYLYLVLLFLIFITAFHAFRKNKEGMDNVEEVIEEVDPVIDTSRATFTDTVSYIPNLLSGTVGSDITLEGNLYTKGNHGIELGSNNRKGEQSGKFYFNDKDGEVQLYGAGMDGQPHKIRLTDTVNVTDLLETTRANIRGYLGFGKDSAGSDGGLYYDRDGNQLSIKGYGKDGDRKVKIWDDAEVGKLFTTRGLDVSGSFHAFNDATVDGNFQTKGKLFANDVSVLGNVEIGGNLSNQRLDFINASLNNLNQQIIDFDRPALVNSIGQAISQGAKYTDDNAAQLRGESNASYQEMRSYVDSTRTDLNTNINKVSAANAAAIQGLTNSLEQSIRDIKIDNASSISWYFNDLTRQINDASANTQTTTGQVVTALASHNASIINVNLVAEDALAKANSWKAQEENINMSLMTAYTNARDYMLNKEGRNASIQYAYTNAMDYNTNKDNLNASIDYAFMNAMDYNANKPSFMNTTTQWNQDAKYLNDSAAGWNNASVRLNNIEEDWATSKIPIESAVTSWNAVNSKYGTKFQDLDKIYPLWNASNNSEILSVGSGDSKWYLVPDATKLRISKVKPNSVEDQALQAQQRLEKQKADETKLQNEINAAREKSIADEQTRVQKMFRPTPVTTSAPMPDNTASRPTNRIWDWTNGILKDTTPAPTPAASTSTANTDSGGYWRNGVYVPPVFNFGNSIF